MPIYSLFLGHSWHFWVEVGEAVVAGGWCLFLWMAEIELGLRSGWFVSNKGAEERGLISLSLSLSLSLYIYIYIYICVCVCVCVCVFFSLMFGGLFGC